LALDFGIYPAFKFDGQVTVNNDHPGAKFVGVKIDECDYDSVFQILFDDSFLPWSDNGDDDVG